MGLIAGLLVQNALKHLLEFGEVSYYLGYNALSDYFPRMAMKPNPICDDIWCLKRQDEYKLAASHNIKVVKCTEDKAEQILHQENDWGIELMSETTPEELAAAEGLRPTLVDGVTVAYTKPSMHHSKESAQCEPLGTSDGGSGEASLDDLMAQMKNM